MYGDIFFLPCGSTNYFSVIAIAKAGRAAPPAAADLAAADLAAATRMTEATATPAVAATVAQGAAVAQAAAAAVAQGAAAVAQAAAAVAGTTGGRRKGTKRLVLGEAMAQLGGRRRGDE